MHYQIQNVKHVKKSKNNIERKTGKRIIVVSIVLIILLTIIGGAAFTAYNMGFIPVNLSVKKPAGTSATVDIACYMQEYPELDEIPNLDKIKYGVYSTDASSNSVKTEYKQQLETEGYNLYREGSILVDGTDFKFTAYLKGLTAVVIIVAENCEAFDDDTVVLYTTGNAFYYREILDWYNNQ